MARPYSGYHRAIERKVAATLHSMVEILIERSGYFLDIDDDEPIDDLVVGVADGQLGFDDLVEWFKPRLKKYC